MTHEHDTQEIEAPGFMNDPKVLAYLEGTDANIDRLVLEEDGKLWAYSKRIPGDLCRSSLETMVAVAFPAYFPAVKAVAAVVIDPVTPKAPRATRKPRKAPAAHSTPTYVPVTGGACGLLAKRLAGSGRPPSVLVAGVFRMAPKPIIEGDRIKVALRDPLGSLVGRAVLSRTDYCTLTETPAIKADTMLWSLNDSGEVTTRVRGNPEAVEVRTVNALLLEIRSDSRVTIEMEAA